MQGLIFLDRNGVSADIKASPTWQIITMSKNLRNVGMSYGLKINSGGNATALPSSVSLWRIGLGQSERWGTEVIRESSDVNPEAKLTVCVCIFKSLQSLSQLIENYHNTEEVEGSVGVRKVEQRVSHALTADN